MKTKSYIMYRAAPYGHVATIPAGTSVILARNLPAADNGEKRYWVKVWRGMSPAERSWARNYGFLLTLSEVKA